MNVIPRNLLYILEVNTKNLHLHQRNQPTALFSRTYLGRRRQIILSSRITNGVKIIQRPHYRRPHLFSAKLRALGILIHEMVAGEPPFGYGGDGLLARISAGLPNGRGSANLGKTRVEDLSGEERSETGTTTDQIAFLPIVGRLLDTDPQQRLGSAAGAEDVMSHDWFEAVDWTKVSKVRACHLYMFSGVYT